MRVALRLFATLVPYLPAASRDGAAELDVADGSTVHDILTTLRVPVDLERVILVNDEPAEPEQRLRAGDVVTVFPPLAGGRSRPAGPPALAPGDWPTPARPH